MSLSGTTNTYLPPTLDGLNIIDADAIYINGIPIDTENLVPYTNATKNVNLGTFNFQTLGSISAKEHIFPSFGSTMMTGPTTSSIFYADTWLMNNTIQISSLGGGSFVSTSYLHIADATNQSTLLTLQSDGIADFANTKLRVSTMATSAYDVVNLSTLTSAVAFIENVNALNYVPYTGATNDLNMGGSTITTTGLLSAGAVRITSSISNMDYSLSVNSFDQLEIRNMTTGNALVTGGDALAILNINAGGTITTGNIEVSGNSQLIGSGTVVWTQTALSDDYEIKDDVGDTRLKLSKTTGLTISTLNVTAVPSATPTLALGVNGSGGVVSFAVPSGGGLLGSNNTWTGVNQFDNTVSTMGANRFIQPYNALVTDVSTLVNRATLNASIAGFGTVNTSTLTARFLPYLSTGTTLTNSLLNQIDNDSMGFGYTAIPNYPLGSGGKNMYINGSIFAGALNSMYATFGRDTNTSNPANEINFTASGAGVLVSQIKSHSGSSPFYDATWTYSNTNPAPLGANQGQVLLTAKNLNVSGIGNIRAGNPFAVPNGYMQTGSLTIGDCSLNYGGGTTLWSSNTAGLLMECLDRTEIAVHDAGARVTSMIFYDGSTNTFTMGRDMGWGVSNVIASNNLTANCLIVNGGGTYQAGCIYSDANWGMLFRAKVVPTIGIFLWNDSAGGERMRMNTVGQLILTTVDGPGFVHTNGTVIVESYIGGAGGWFGTRTNHPLRFYANNSSARMTLNTGGDMTHTAGDSSYMKYGPNSTWNANLVVGATPDRAGAGTAQVITTNGNLHIDAGNSTDIYYGYYANARGTPNVHRWYGNDYNFVAVPQNFSQFSHVCVFAGDQMRRSQCMMRQVYRNESISWSGGINMTYAFYKFNAKCPVKLSGKYSCYSTYVGIQNVGMRIYSQTSGAYFYYNFRTYQNLTYVQTTYPFELILTEADLGAFSTGWYDFYIYGVAGQISTDGNNQLQVNVEVLPVDAF